MNDAELAGNDVEGCWGAQSLTRPRCVLLVTVADRGSGNMSQLEGGRTSLKILECVTLEKLRCLRFPNTNNHQTSPGVTSRHRSGYGGQSWCRRCRQQFTDRGQFVVCQSHMRGPRTLFPSGHEHPYLKRRGPHSGSKHRRSVITADGEAMPIKWIGRNLFKKARARLGPRACSLSGCHASQSTTRRLMRICISLLNTPCTLMGS